MTPALPLIGHQTAQDRFLKARASGRLHHGWIFSGPSGIGKSLFAKRLAALMLGAQNVDADASDPVMQKVLSGSHPDLKWIKRELNEKGQLRQDIIVDQIRDLNKFFSLRPALAGWRVGVVDSLDEMNLNGMNAILKTLEEPPENAILFLVSHGTKPVLATIRSRCQVLRLNRLSDDETRQVLETIDDAGQLAFDLANGRPGYGVQLQATGGSKAVQATRVLVQSIHKPRSEIVSAALNAAAADAGSLAAYTDVLLEWTAEQAEKTPSLGQTWLNLHQVRANAIELNLTHLQTAAKLLSVLQDGLKTLALRA